MEQSILDSETVARILKRDWFDDGKLMHVAFALRNGETYISVNRLSSESFEEDVKSFVKTHPDYSFGEDSQEYSCANLNVGDIRDMHVALDAESIDIEVEVEPRDTHIKSHAGIFTRYKNVNLKPGASVVSEGARTVFAADAILLKVRLQLLSKAQCLQVRFTSEK